jgi:methyltransferase (TIGR00027 family)
VAERRAAHQLLDVPVVLKDPLALKIVGATRPEERARLSAREQGRLSRTLRAFVAARARVVEDEIARGAAAGLTQYVVLGAGLDTFAYRNPFSPQLRVFEVDHEATQSWKRESLAAAGIAAEGMVTFVTVNFEVDDVFARLADAGWDSTTPTLFACLGVTMYLETETVAQMLRGLGRQVPGSAVIVDYAIAPSLLGPVEQLVFEEFAKRVAAAGEPWVSSFAPAAFAQQVRDAGFTQVEDFGPDDLNGRYFSERTDGMRVGTLAHIIKARV